MGDEAPIAMLIVFWAFAAVLVPSARWIGRVTVWSRRSFKERVLIIGAGEVGHTLAAKIAVHPEYRIELIGFLDDGEPRRNGHDGAGVGSSARWTTWTRSSPGSRSTA